MEAVRKKPRWYMTDSEIAVSFRQAANREYQIRVISELNLKTVDETMDKLSTLGFDMEPYKKRNHTRIDYRSWQGEEIKMLLRLRDVYRMAWKEIAKALQRTPESCMNKYMRVKGVYK